MGDGPTGYIRGLSVRKTPTGVMRTLLVVSGNIPLHDEVVGFCEYGVGAETTEEHEGIYQISYIATALKVRGHTSRRHAARLGDYEAS